MHEDMFGCVLWVAVHPEFRRKGLASALVEAGTKSLKQRRSKSGFCFDSEKKHGVAFSF